MSEIMLMLTRESDTKLLQPQFLSFVLRALNQADRSAKLNLVCVLGVHARAGSIEAMKALKKCLHDLDVDVRQNAEVELAKSKT